MYKYAQHKKNDKEARIAYCEDKSIKWNANTEIYAVNIQKITILPKMTTKNSFVVSRLVVMNETVAFLREKVKNLCIGHTYMKADSVLGQIGALRTKMEEILTHDD